MASKGGNRDSMVAALDFGTTFSGYAFSFRHEFENDPLKISASHWTSGSRAAISLKTSTCILFNPRRRFDSFGFEAEDKYSDLTLDGFHRDWFYFSRFKMMLYSAQGLHRTAEIKEESGKSMPAIDVFSAAIGYLKEHVIRTCDARCPGGVHQADIKWVLTVPAIWEDHAKQFMREAAIQAGIDGSRLLLALEPEAASMFCKYLPLERIRSTGQGDITCFQPGSKYLIFDAGGGTVDITVHEVQGNRRLRELYKANGGPWGGTTVDKAFMDLLQDITGPEVLHHFTEAYKDDHLDILREFEVKKRTITPSLESKLTFKIPIALHDAHRELKGKEIREGLKSRPDLAGKLTFAGDKMRMDPEVSKNLFKPTCDRIVSHLKSIFSEPAVRGTDVILMVGAFSESPMLQHCIETCFPDKRVIIPHDAGLAVLKGAVIFGHSSREITSRISKYTYGLKVYKDFQPGVHPESKKTVMNGRPQARGCFDKLVEVGQSVSTDDKYTGKTYIPAQHHGTSFTVKLFASPEKAPLFVDDPGCISVGEVEVECRDRRGHVGSATVTLVFGGTELEVKAVHDTTGETTSAKFKFLD